MTKKRVFISYCSADKHKVDILKERIAQSELLAAVVVPEQRDALKPLTEKVRKGLEEAAYVVPIMTKCSVREQWINQEIGFCAARDSMISIRPVVEKEIVDGLKGFIHKELDLPYRFTDKDDEGHLAFREQCDMLIRDIERELSPATSAELREHELHEGLTAEQLFPGIWNNSYSTKKDGTKFRSEPFEIRSTNQYWTGDSHVFDIQKLKIDPQTFRVSFTKSDVRKAGRKIEAVVTLDEPGKFSGIETGNGPARKVKYTRLS